MENLISLKSEDSNNFIKIGNIVIETIDVPGNNGIRIGNIKTNFKKIYCVFLTGYITKGQSQENLMRQVIHSGTNEMVFNKKIEFYAAGNQTITLTIIGEI